MIIRIFALGPILQVIPMAINHIQEQDFEVMFLFYLVISISRFRHLL